MSDRILRQAVIAEVVLAIFLALFLLVDLLEQPESRIHVPVGAPLLILVVLGMIGVGVVALWRARRLK